MAHMTSLSNMKNSKVALSASRGEKQPNPLMGGALPVGQYKPLNPDAMMLNLDKAPVSSPQDKPTAASVPGVQSFASVQVDAKHTDGPTGM